MTTQHTPGPWEIIESNGQIETTVCGPIKATYRRTRNVSDEERTANMAAMEIEAMANAHLIAAAPALLAAAEVIARTKAIRTQLELYDPKALEQIEASIKQAKEGAA